MMERRVPRSPSAADGGTHGEEAVKTGASGKKALVVVDMLSDFVRPGAPLEVPETRAILPALRRRIASARRDGELVVYVCDSHRKNDPEFARMGWPPHAVEGTPGAGVVASLAPEPGDVVVEKRTYSGFHATPLHFILRRNGIRSLTSPAASPTSASSTPRPTPRCAATTRRWTSGSWRGLRPIRMRFALDQMERVLGVRVVRRPVRSAPRR